MLLFFCFVFLLFFFGSGRCGQDYGWNRFEGDLCHRDNEFAEAELGDCADASRDYVSPYFQYCHPGYDSATDDNKYTGGIDVCGDRAVTGMAVIGEREAFYRP